MTDPRSRGEPWRGIAFSFAVWVIVFAAIGGGWWLGGVACRAIPWGAVVPACAFDGR